jgi:YD repeat-containing protein
LLQLQPEIASYHEKGLQFLLITADSQETIETIFEEYSVDIPVLSDPANQIASSLGVQGWPTGMLFDRNGRLVEKTIGWNPSGSLAAWKRKADAELDKP